LAIDPKARMMFLPLSALALLLAATLMRLAEAGRGAIVAAVVLVEAGTGLFILFFHQHVYRREPNRVTESGSPSLTNRTSEGQFLH
jgi:hypothetical protein